jgi:hypothetical protein
MMEAVSSSEMSVIIFQTTWCNIPEDSHLQDADDFLQSTMVQYYRYVDSVWSLHPEDGDCLFV